MYVLLSLFYFLSGLAGIVYEVIWIRFYTSIMGSSTQTISAVVTVYLLGLAAGSFIMGRKIDRLARPLRTYARLEIATGLSALFSYFIFIQLHRFESILLGFLNAGMVKDIIFIFPLLFVFLLTFFIGATFPVITKSLIRYKEQLKEKIGRWYSINTFGAGVGALVSVLVLIQYFGYQDTLLICMMINVTMGLVVWTVESHSFIQSGTGNKEEIAETKGQEKEGGLIFPLLAFVSGFTALGYEVLWSRIMSFLLKGWLIGFSLLLCFYLLGVAVGSLLLVRQRFKDILSSLGIIQLVIAFFSILLFLVLQNAQVQFYSKVVILLPVVFIVCSNFGVLFPLLSASYTRNFQWLGTSIGTVFLANTLGNVSGSLMTGFILIPSLGTERSYFVLISITMLLAAVILYHSSRKFNRGLSFIIFIVLFCLAIFFMPRPGAFTDMFYLSSGKGKGKILYSMENYMGRKVVLMKRRYKYLYADSELSGATDPVRRKDQILQGHIPMLLRDGLKNILEIGYGVGQIAWSIQQYKPESFDMIEIDPDMIPVAERFFSEINHNLSRLDHVHTVIMDGRHYLGVTRKKYDLIESDSFFIFSEGSTRLYTREHFKQAKEHLTKNGLCLCWIPGNLRTEAALSIIKAFQSVFPRYIGWHFPVLEKKKSTYDIFLIASRDNVKYKMSELMKRFDQTGKKELSSLGLPDKFQFLSGFFPGELMDELGIKRVPAHTEDKPYVDYHVLPTFKEPADNIISRGINAHSVQASLSWFDGYFSFKDCSQEQVTNSIKKWRRRKDGP